MRISSIFTKQNEICFFEYFQKKSITPVLHLSYLSWLPFSRPLGVCSRLFGHQNDSYSFVQSIGLFFVQKVRKICLFVHFFSSQFRWFLSTRAIIWVANVTIPRYHPFLDLKTARSWNGIQDSGTPQK